MLFSVLTSSCSLIMQVRLQKKFLSLLFVALFAVSAVAADGSLARVRERGILLWGADAEGGAPYAFPDPKNNSRLIGFEVELAQAISQKLGVKLRTVQNTWDSLVPGLIRGDYDITMNGIEITPERSQGVLFSRPYYVYSEQLVVRKEEIRISNISDLPGKRVGTLNGAVAHQMLQKISGVDIRVYSGVVEPYEDLALGRLDAVFLDLPIATYYAKHNPRLRFVGDPVGEGLYGIAFRKNDEELKQKTDTVISELLSSGELQKMYERWGLWNSLQEKLSTEFASGPAAVNEGRKSSLLSFLPSLLKGAGLTILLSVASMSLAIFLGLVISIGKLYGHPATSFLCTAYIELYRGTPLLVQLYLIYYGLPNLGVSLSPVVAAILGLGMNYAAYEAEIYRGGFNSVAKGQWEAASTLGMSRWLTMRHVILPQAVRVALPGITNDFIALLKDSSLVSVISMVELTKTYTIYAASTLRYLELGLVTALLYFGMSWPLSYWARRLEYRLHKAPR